MANLPNLRTVRSNVLLLVRERNNKTEKEKHGWPQQPFLAGVPTSVHYTRSGCQGRLEHRPWPHPPLWHGIASSLRTTNTGLRLKSTELCRRMFSLYSNLRIYTRGTIMKVQHTDAKGTGILGTSQIGKDVLIPMYFYVSSLWRECKQVDTNHLLNMNTKLSH